MIKTLYIPADLKDSALTVAAVHVARMDRIRKNMALLELDLGGTRQTVHSEHDGWVRFVGVRPEMAVSAGDLMMIIDVISEADYRPDSAEVNAHSELGDNGRRGIERQLQDEFAKAYSNPLFDPPDNKGNPGSQLPQNPLMRNMKEGVPPKMRSNAANNQQAINKMVEDASVDPELRKQLSAQLQQELSVSPSPSVTPSNRPG